MEQTRMAWGETVGEFVRQIEQKVKPHSIEIGFEPEPDGTDPLPGHPATWYVDIGLSETLHVRKQARGIIQGMTILEALAAAAEAVGISVRLRYE